MQRGRCRRCLKELAIGEVDYRSVRIVQEGRSYTAEIREDFLKEVAFGWDSTASQMDRIWMGQRWAKGPGNRSGSEAQVCVSGGWLERGWDAGSDQAGSWLPGYRKWI